MQTIVNRMRLPAALSACALLMFAPLIDRRRGGQCQAPDRSRQWAKKSLLTGSKGNCLACHMIEDGELPGTIAPPLLAMTATISGQGRAAGANMGRRQ